MEPRNTYSPPPELKRDPANNSTVCNGASPIPLQVHTLASTFEKGYPFVSANMPTHMYANGIVSPLSPPATRNASPTPARLTRSHARAVHEEWRKLNNLLEGEQIVLDGESLDIQSLVAVARLVFCVILCVKPHCWGSAGIDEMQHWNRVERFFRGLRRVLQCFKKS